MQPFSTYRRPSHPFALAAALGAVFAAAAVAPPAHASGFLLFQHGGRGAGEAGALTARAGDPSAMTYNPAGLVHLDGLQAQAGIDFSTPTDSYENAAGRFDDTHEINFPPSAYLTWKPTGGPWAFGLGVDEPMFDNVHWGPKQFPGRFLTRRQETQISELHLAAAYDLGAGWSAALGVRYAYGRIKAGSNALRALPGQNAAQEVEIDYSSIVTGTGFDGAVQYRTDVWGFGATLRSALDAKGHSDPKVTPRTDVLPPLAAGGLALDTRRQELAMETPLQAAIGGWIAPYPELRVELDAVYAAWGSTGNRTFFYPGGVAADRVTFRDRNWRDTLSLRAGVEGDVTDAVVVYAGVAFEPSPVPSSTLEPGFDRGDSFVYGLGASYNFPQISFDAGWSMHQLQGRDASGQELLAPQASGRYTSHDQQFSLSVRWRFAS